MKPLILILSFISLLFANLPPQITYNENHQPLVVEYEDGSVVEFDYDALTHLATVTDNQGTVSYEYDAIGRQTQVTFANGVTSHYTYDSRNRITSIVHKSSDGTVLQSFTYTLDAVGNRTSIVELSGRTTEYEYNDVGQLSKEVVSNDPNGNNTTTTFTYDDVGNLVTKTIDGADTSYTYNANDQLTQQGSKTFTYDANGNMVSDGTNSYSYDDKNRLISLTTPTDTVEYSYDANDNRVAKIVNGDTTTYLVDANTPYAQVITESKSDGARVDYTYGNDLLSDGSHNFLTDALGSTRGLVDSAEQLTDTYDYKPYGEIANHTGSSDNAFLFTGEQYDSETDNYYLRARYYDPATSRFLSRDTYDGKLIDPLSQNRYLYAAGNPVMYVDPSGHENLLTLNMKMVTMNILVRSGIKALAITSGIMFQLRANKMYDLSIRKQPFLDNILQTYIQHTYINASEIEWEGSGYRYDKGSTKPEMAVYGIPTEGHVKKSPIVSSEWTNNSFVQLSPLQFVVWERENYEFVNKKHYQLIYSSCWTWTYSSWLSGLRIMLTVPSI